MIIIRDRLKLFFMIYNMIFYTHTILLNIFLDKKPYELIVGLKVLFPVRFLKIFYKFVYKFYKRDTY